MDIDDLQVEFDGWCNRADLMTASNLLIRAEAMDFLRFLQQEIQEAHQQNPTATQLLAEAQTLESRLQQCNQSQFYYLRSAIQTRCLQGEELRQYLNQFIGDDSATGEHMYSSYDGLDILVDGLFSLQNAPGPTRSLTANMVHCEETPARAIFDLLDHVGWQSHDIFYDLGAGLGQVVMLVNLLAGIDARGVEYEPAFVDFARHQAQVLGLSPVSFANEDARTADYHDGTIFFLFTPFRGEILQTVLDCLRTIAVEHPIRLCTLGPITPRVAQERWLHVIHGDASHEYQLVIFHSN